MTTINKNCEYCDSRLILMSGWVDLKADQEPYESGVIETPEIGGAVIFVICHICPKCKKTKNLQQEE